MHPIQRWVSRQFRPLRKAVLKKLRPLQRIWRDRWIPLWHARTIRYLLMVDETGNKNGPHTQYFLGASGVLLPKTSQLEFEGICRSFRERLAHYEIPTNVEIHAVDWVHGTEKLVGHVPVGVRIDLLREFMRQCGKCSGLQLIHVVADSSAPRPAPSKRPLKPDQLERLLRREIFTKLLQEFDNRLDTVQQKGHLWLDENKVGAIIELAGKLEPPLRWQPLPPIAVDSAKHDAIQLADVCAYFMLQRFAANGTIEYEQASRYLDEVAHLCPDPQQNSAALVYEV